LEYSLLSLYRQLELEDMLNLQFRHQQVLQRNFLGQLFSGGTDAASLQALVIYHLMLLMLAMICDILLSAFTRKKYFRHFPFVIATMGTTILFATQYLLTDWVTFSAVQYVPLAEFLLVVLHLIIVGE
jgi:hypothetical protein